MTAPGEDDTGKRHISLIFASIVLSTLPGRFVEGSLSDHVALLVGVAVGLYVTGRLTGGLLPRERR